MIDRGRIYSIKHIASGREYIGATFRDPEIRWFEHIRAAACDSTRALHSALRGFGCAAFKFAVIWEGSVEQMANAECRFIAERHTLDPDGYNLTAGGEGCMITPEVRERMRLVSASRLAEPLVLPVSVPDHFAKRLEKLRKRTGRKICLLSAIEAARLVNWCIWPECKYHLHTKRNKLVDKHYKLIQCIDGTTIPFAAPFDATETFGWATNEMMRMMENNAFANRFKPVHARCVRPTMLAHRPGVTEADQAMWK